jgi:hypothetical protein
MGRIEETGCGAEWEEEEGEKSWVKGMDLDPILSKTSNQPTD